MDETIAGKNYPDQFITGLDALPLLLKLPADESLHFIRVHLGCDKPELPSKP